MSEQSSRTAGGDVADEVGDHRGPVRPVGQDRGKGRVRKKITPYVLSTPAFVLVVGIMAYPIVTGFWRSFFESPGLLQPDVFVGPSRYVELFRDPLFVDALGRSAFLVVTTIVIGMVISVVYALLLTAWGRFGNVLRTISLVPYLISGVATAVIWRFLFSPQNGVLERMLATVGIEGGNWLSDPNRALWVIVITHVWAVSPLSTLILYGGLKTVPGDLYEAASVDGATSRQMFMKITLPWISPQIALSLVWLSFASFNTFDLILAMTGGGPGRSTEVVALVMYAIAFDQLDFNTSYMVMVILLAINAVFSIGYIALIPKLRGGS